MAVTKRTIQMVKFDGTILLYDTCIVAANLKKYFKCKDFLREMTLYDTRHWIKTLLELKASKLVTYHEKITFSQLIHAIKPVPADLVLLTESFVSLT